MPMFFCRQLRNYLLKIRKKDKLLAFLKPFVFPEWLVWPRTMQFRQTWPKFLGRILRKIRSSSNRNWNMLKFFHKMFLWRSRMQFWQNCWFFSKGLNFFQLTIRRQKKFFKIFSQMVSLVSYKAVPTELPPLIS